MTENPVTENTVGIKPVSPAGSTAGYKDSSMAAALAGSASASTNQSVLREKQAQQGAAVTGTSLTGTSLTGVALTSAATTATVSGAGMLKAGNTAMPTLTSCDAAATVVAAPAALAALTLEHSVNHSNSLETTALLMATLEAPMMIPLTARGYLDLLCPEGMALFDWSKQPDPALIDPEQYDAVMVVYHAKKAASFVTRAMPYGISSDLVSSLAYATAVARNSCAHNDY